MRAWNVGERGVSMRVAEIVAESGSVRMSGVIDLKHFEYQSIHK